MYKVLIVEDDMNFRFAIRETIPWREHGFEIAGEAIHGRQAVDFLEKQSVNIVLTDMSMPLMNGVELTRWVCEHCPETQVIALSAYDDFEFVKESLKYGASDYILKQNLHPDEMIQLLEKLCANREKQKQKQEEHERREHELRLFLRENRVLEAETKTYFEKMLPACRFFGMVVRTENIFLQELLHRLRKDEHVLYAISDHDEKVLAFYRLEQNPSREAILDQMHRYAVDVVGNKTEQVHVFVSRESGAGYGMFALLDELIELMELEKFYGQYHVFCYYDFEGRINSRSRDYIYEPQEGKYINVKSVEKEAAAMRASLQKKLPEEAYVNRSYFNYTERIMEELKQDGWDPVQYYKGLEQQRSLKDKERLMLDTLAKAYEKEEYRYADKPREILQAIRYIQEHFGEDISLGEVAEHVGLSENYFSNVFKASMSENFTHYMNTVRIEQAKHLMNTTNMKVYEIAEAVGYHNATYFSTIFKKITHMAVSDYKKNPHL